MPGKRMSSRKSPYLKPLLTSPYSEAEVKRVKIGSEEFKVPVNAPSIPCSAMQNKKAGNKLPSTPDMKMVNNLSFGIILKYLDPYNFCRHIQSANETFLLQRSFRQLWR